MTEIIDKVILFLCTLVLFLFHGNILLAVIPVILSIVLSSLFSYFEINPIRLSGILIYGIICIFIPEYIIFLPLLLYDLLQSRYQYTGLIIPLLFFINRSSYTPPIYAFTTVFMALSYLLKYRTDKMNILQLEYNDLRDTSSSFSQVLEEKNRSILQNQDYEINLATLNERNRISREIHDHIGHLLSRALLQVGALITIAKEDPLREELIVLKGSLSQGMDDIRNSIHKMYDESIDLYVQIELLTKSFTFCPLHFEYDISTPPPLVVKHSLIAITKEALANIIRHSNGNQASIILREHPAMYQLIIQDNGSLVDSKKDLIKKQIGPVADGANMGLKNISNRVTGFGGNLYITIDNGFKIFITIPKNSEWKGDTP